MFYSLISNKDRKIREDLKIQDEARLTKGRWDDKTKIKYHPGFNKSLAEIVKGALK